MSVSTRPLRRSSRFDRRHAVGRAHGRNRPERPHRKQAVPRTAGLEKGVDISRKSSLPMKKPGDSGRALGRSNDGHPVLFSSSTVHRALFIVSTGKTDPAVTHTSVKPCAGFKTRSADLTENLIVKPLFSQTSFSYCLEFPSAPEAHRSCNPDLPDRSRES